MDCLSIVNCPACTSLCERGSAYLSLIQNRIGGQSLQSLSARVRQSQTPKETLLTIEQGLFSGKTESDLARELGVSRQAVNLRVTRFLPHFLSIFQPLPSTPSPKKPHELTCRECGQKFLHMLRRTKYCATCQSQVRSRQTREWKNRAYRTNPVVRERVLAYTSQYSRRPEIIERRRRIARGEIIPRPYIHH